MGEEKVGAPPRTSWRDVRGAALCVAASLLFSGLFVWISELQSRIGDLERQQITACTRSAEQVEPLILGRLDHILEEKLAAHLSKRREAREAPHGCLCPPGFSLLGRLAHDFTVADGLMLQCHVSLFSHCGVTARNLP
ncbi:hypothetical protein fugu_012840 [Takifugu bimaculatus]|uniref:Uncharacterized protein n=1 Tax=Takifugu bimaculatus TaxID=433685 RepID=A0A4Z2C6H0_9TELE|nr:hypothetical protein fugu_012840 [Takifugu bimaculatus]